MNLPFVKIFCTRKFAVLRYLSISMSESFHSYIFPKVVRVYYTALHYIKVSVSIPCILTSWNFIHYSWPKLSFFLLSGKSITPSPRDSWKVKHIAWNASYDIDMDAWQLFGLYFLVIWILVQWQTDGQKAMHMSPPCTSTGVLKNL